MRAMKLLPTAALLLVASSVASGNPGAQTPVFEYDAGPSTTPSDIRLAVLQPAIYFAGDEAPGPGARTLPQFLRIAARSRGGAQSRLSAQQSEGHRFQQRFRTHYAPQLQQALARATEELLTSRGFHSGGVYAEYADLSPEQRQQILALTAVQATLAITDKVASRECTEYRCIERGKIKVDAQVLLQLAEASQGYTAVFRVTHLYGSDIHQDYVLEHGVEPDGLWETVKRWFRPSQPLRDTTDEALAKLTAEVFEQTMQRIDQMVSRQRARLVAFGKQKQPQEDSAERPL